MGKMKEINFHLKMLLIRGLPECGRNDQRPRAGWHTASSAFSWLWRKAGVPGPHRNAFILAASLGGRRRSEVSRRQDDQVSSSGRHSSPVPSSLIDRGSSSISFSGKLKDASSSTSSSVRFGGYCPEPREVLPPDRA